MPKPRSPRRMPAIATLQGEVDEMTVKAPIAAQVYQVGAELGRICVARAFRCCRWSTSATSGCASTCARIWSRASRSATASTSGPRARRRAGQVEVRTIATRGEYAGWRATRATGDFDLRTFEVRAYPVDSSPILRPGHERLCHWTG